MRKIVTLCFILLLVAALCACSTNTPANAPAESAAAGGASAASASIMVQPPEGWSAVEGAVIPAQYMKGTASFIAKTESFASTDLGGVVSEAKKVFESTFEGVKYDGDTQTIKVAGHDAAKFLFTCSLNGVEMKYEYVYLFAGSKVWAITFGDMAESFDAQAGDYQQILDSIQLK